MPFRPSLAARWPPKAKQLVLPLLCPYPPPPPVRPPAPTSLARFSLINQRDYVLADRHGWARSSTLLPLQLLPLLSLLSLPFLIPALALPQPWRRQQKSPRRPNQHPKQKRKKKQGPALPQPASQIGPSSSLVLSLVRPLVPIHPPPLCLTPSSSHPSPFSFSPPTPPDDAFSTSCILIVACLVSFVSVVSFRCRRPLLPRLLSTPCANPSMGCATATAMPLAFPSEPKGQEVRVVGAEKPWSEPTTTSPPWWLRLRPYPCCM